MLKNISSLLSPDLLKILAEMGHGDEIVLADSNFPAASHAACFSQSRWSQRPGFTHRDSKTLPAGYVCGISCGRHGTR